jgi:hypothetical protein
VPEARQTIKVGAKGGRDCLPHASQDTDEREKKVPGKRYTLKKGIPQ